MFGSVTRQNNCHGFAPRLTAANSSSGPSASMSGISSRATNGSVTNVVASTSAGHEKRTWNPFSRSHGPRSPFIPNRSTSINPFFTLFDIMVTANHYWIDGVGGLICLGGGYLVALAGTRWWESRHGIPAAKTVAGATNPAAAFARLGGSAG